jgi:hypothetical protein
MMATSKVILFVNEIPVAAANKHVKKKEQEREPAEESPIPPAGLAGG